MIVVKKKVERRRPLLYQATAAASDFVEDGDEVEDDDAIFWMLLLLLFTHLLLSLASSISICSCLHSLLQNGVSPLQKHRIRETQIQHLIHFFFKKNNFTSTEANLEMNQSISIQGMCSVSLILMDSVDCDHSSTNRARDETSCIGALELNEMVYRYMKMSELNPRGLLQREHDRRKWCS